MLCPLLLSNYPYVGRLGLQGVSVATQGATDYLRISAQIKNVADNLSYLCVVMTGLHSNPNHNHGVGVSTPDLKYPSSHQRSVH